jgi:hypothetical protein
MNALLFIDYLLCRCMALNPNSLLPAGGAAAGLDHAQLAAQ